MDIFQVFFLSFIEGVTEFLPISSTGHLILASSLLGLSHSEFQKSFEIMIQLGAIFAVVVFYFSTFIRKIDVWKKILIAFFPTGISGFLLYKIVKNYFLGNSSIVIISLFIGGMVLIFLEKIYKEKKNNLNSIEKISYQKAFLIGVFQSLSLIPGVSRAAATIFGGLFLGLKRKTAVEFSFLLAVPTMFFASVFDFYKSRFDFTLNEYWLLTLGFFGAFITAFFTVKYFLRYIQTHNFIPFGIYRMILAVVFWVIGVK